jgi:glutamine synthetase
VRQKGRVEKTGGRLLSELSGRGVKRIKLGIADIDGILRGKYLSFEKFESLARGSGSFCDCIFGWDSQDQLYDNGSFSGWHKGFPDLAYRLDPASLRWLPWEPETPYFIGELAPEAGEEFHPICPRNILKRVVAKAEALGFQPELAFEYEFFLFQETPQSLREKGYRNLVPFTPGMFGYSVLRSSVQSQLFNDFLDHCRALRVDLEGLHTETGPGVLEAAIGHAPGVEAADRAALFKTFTKVFFQRRGLLATFMAKWSNDYPGQSGHLHQSLADRKTGKPLFHQKGGRSSMSPAMESFVAGQTRFLRELCAMIAPTVNSYRRMVKGAWAPTAATWGLDNRTVAIRVVPGSPETQRVEHRLAAADGNPYLVAAAALASGLAGIEEGLKLEEPVTGNGYDAQGSLPLERQLPPTLREAAALFRRSKLARRTFGDDFVDHFAGSREWETREFERAITDWELKRYFEII